jgi:hypothetical protein
MSFLRRLAFGVTAATALSASAQNNDLAQAQAQPDSLGYIYHDNGQVEMETPYKDGWYHGTEVYYTEDGNRLWERDHYRDGRAQFGAYYGEEGNLTSVRNTWRDPDSDIGGEIYNRARNRRMARALFFMKLGDNVKQVFGDNRTPREVGADQAEKMRARFTEKNERFVKTRLEKAHAKQARSDARYRRRHG